MQRHTSKGIIACRSAVQNARLGALDRVCVWGGGGGRTH
jgi:hypothetical protein